MLSLPSVHTIRFKLYFVDDLPRSRAHFYQTVLSATASTVIIIKDTSFTFFICRNESFAKSFWAFGANRWESVEVIVVWEDYN